MWYGLTSTHSPLRFGRKRQMLLQPKGPSFSSTQLDRQSQIRESFFRTYRMYAKPSWSHAHVAPLSLLSKNPDNEDGATIVDSLTALHIMNLRVSNAGVILFIWAYIDELTAQTNRPQEEFEAALDQTINMDFQVSNAKGEATLTPETTIRCLGAILSTYELLGKNQTKLLHKAQELGNQLQNSWNFNQSAVPYPWLHFGPNQKDEKKTITIAQAASLTLEFNRLSHWTGNNSYRARADESSRHIMSQSDCLNLAESGCVLTMATITHRQSSGFPRPIFAKSDFC
ncbi:Mannosyl-oligosaccharide 1,2-alpha-mannosidase IB [Puccinia graminis f. sp. tritici]|uniref:mannosyl-oligosaccharide 1,2-alpha-mannosidase n=1 Tax=Puccinia graminis f. sp. tritici TaxID=56615 RepID=A0A5B0P1Z9_PUCGR|nr:Mannosyl-oligosaccharide 1,2-alpha-mannosidase IB [Puccinia graminis f. sp. tritici]